MIGGLKNGRPFGSEQQLVRAILDYLQTFQIPHAHIRNTGSIQRRRDGTLFFGRSSHSQRGVPDILACKRGRSVAIECKAVNGKLSEEQTEWLKRHSMHGGASMVPRTIEEFMSAWSQLELRG